MSGRDAASRGKTTAPAKPAQSLGGIACDASDGSPLGL
jgi:hypothetical protein